MLEIDRPVLWRDHSQGGAGCDSIVNPPEGNVVAGAPDGSPGPPGRVAPGRPRIPFG